MFETVRNQPGLLFVIATLLPLGSFALLLAWGALRWGLRPYAKNGSLVDNVYQCLGGPVPGPGPAYVATAAIGLAFLCSFIGFGVFLSEVGEMHRLEHHLHELHLEHAKPHGHKAEPEAKKDEKEDAKQAKLVKKEPERNLQGEYNILRHHWLGSTTWAQVVSTKTKDAERGSILTVGFKIDMLAAVMFVMVTFIATLIHLFSIGYMSDELKKTVEDHEVHTPHGHYERRGRFGRFFMFLSLFCFSMLNLLLADNLFQIFVSWELVGICSFLLVGFYFERTSASNAANKAFITNRVGDAGFIIGLMILWTYCGTFNFEELFAQIRCPKADADGEIVLEEKIKANDKIQIRKTNLSNKIVRCDPGENTEYGWRQTNLAKDGKAVLLFPRDQSGHFHGPHQTEYLFDHPGAKQYGHMPYWLLVVAGLGIFLGCVGKSAQFPLQVWLPDAMEGPTPVSALIHAATMVAAGVYLVGRSYPLFTPEVLLTISYVGAITLFVAATIAVVMTDIKKVLAYSTVSQLGYMMLGLGIGGWTAGLLHLLTHAFFKALLFLGSGSVIYGCHHQQDMRKMGGLFPKMKITALAMLMGVLAISGIPLFSGWYSKDEILAGAFGFAMVNKQHFLLFLLPLATAGITTFYMFRMWFMTFMGKPRDEHVYEHAHESPWQMTVPLILLAILSVTVAWPKPDEHGWPLFDAQQSWLAHQLHHYSQPKTIEVEDVEDAHGHPIPLDVDFVKENQAALAHHAGVGYLALGVVAIGLIFALALYLYGWLDPAEAKEQFPGVHRFLLHKWYFDELYSAAIVRPGMVIAHWCRNFDTYAIDGFVNLLGRWNLNASYWSGKFDRGIIDGFVNVLADASYAVGNGLRNVQTGYLRSYVLFLALSAVALTVLLYAWVAALGG